MNDIIRALNAAQALIAYLIGRGLTRERVIALLELAESEERDLTDAEVQAALDQTAAELDATENLIEGET